MVSLVHIYFIAVSVHQFLYKGCLQENPDMITTGGYIERYSKSLRYSSISLTILSTLIGQQNIYVYMNEPMTSDLLLISRFLII